VALLPQVEMYGQLRPDLTMLRGLELPRPLVCSGKSGQGDYGRVGYGSEGR